MVRFFDNKWENNVIFKFNISSLKKRYFNTNSHKYSVLISMKNYYNQTLPNQNIKRWKKKEIFSFLFSDTMVYHYLLIRLLNYFQQEKEIQNFLIKKITCITKYPSFNFRSSGITKLVAWYSNTSSWNL